MYEGNGTCRAQMRRRIQKIYGLKGEGRKEWRKYEHTGRKRGSLGKNRGSQKEYSGIGRKRQRGAKKRGRKK